MDSKINLPVVTDDKPVPVRRSDVERLADKISFDIDYFLNLILVPNTDIITRPNIYVIERFINHRIDRWISFPYIRATITLHAPWMKESKCNGASQFNSTVMIFEGKIMEDDEPTITLDFQTRHIEKGNGFESCFNTIKKYIWYDI